VPEPGGAELADRVEVGLMAGRTAWVLGDQLTHANPVLDGAERVLIVESRAKLASGPPGFHRQKLHLILVAMRAFAQELRDRGLEVDHRPARSLESGLRAHMRRYRPESIQVLEPKRLGAGARLARLPRVELVAGGLFLTSPDEFAAWADGRKRLVMESFYRFQRRRYGLLMDGTEPAGGHWNFDRENREPPPRGERPPRPYSPREGALDDEVRRDLDRMRLATSGEDGPRRFPATRAEARRALNAFVERRLPDFGRWQDAMLNGESWMWHSLLGSSLNLGLLDPLECARSAERAYRTGNVPLAAAEGFIRQIIGWREYVWGVYRLRGREWLRMNALRARTHLPEAFWTAATEMRCLADVASKVRDTAYAHHIERLMVAGNLMLLLGVRPSEAYDWFHRSFVDGYEWVMAPNVLGMATWADGGRMMTKPYAASGRYIDRMSDHCRECRYTPSERASDDACPFTTLYWDFLDRNRASLTGNRRMAMPYRNLDRIDPAELDEIRSRALGLRRRFSA
jgi:deoxyribodipyrimidine photolyase-related protein